MNKNNSSNIIEVLKRHFESKNINTVFAPVVPELAELYISYYIILTRLDEIKPLLKENDLLEKIMAMEFSIKEGCFDLLKMIESCSDRKITVHMAKCDENLFKIAHKYHSDILEILELNKIKKIYSLEEDKPVLVPVKTN